VFGIAKEIVMVIRSRDFTIVLLAVATGLAGWQAQAGAQVLPAAPPTTVSAAEATAGGAAQAAAPVKWSNTRTSPTPAGNKTLHGPFGNDLVTVTAENLPAHDWLDVTIELVVIRTWDGSVEITDEATPTGPDFFYAGLAGGGPLVYTTFSNLSEDVFDAGSRTQNFPSVIPGDRLPARSGAMAKNTLGYEFTRESTGLTYKMDTTYRISLLVPHKEAKAALELAAMNLQEAADESWGVLNVQVQALAASAVPAPSEEAIAKAFAGAARPGGADPQTDFRTLVAGTQRTVAWIEKNVAPKTIAGEAAAAALHKIIEPANDIEVGEGRTKLVEMGPQAEVVLRDAYRGASEHAKVGIDSTLQVLGVTPISDEATRRVMLATRVLEMIGTPEAMALRKKLAVP
jgi:hypothetical protein